MAQARASRDLTSSSLVCGKLPVPAADSRKWLGRCQADHIIGFLLQPLHRIGRGHGYGDHDRGGLSLLQGGDGGQHARPGGQAVVHQNHAVIFYRGRRLVSSISPFAPFQFLPLCCGGSLNVLLADIDAPLLYRDSARTRRRWRLRPSPIPPVRAFPACAPA